MKEQLPESNRGCLERVKEFLPNTNTDAFLPQVSFRDGQIFRICPNIKDLQNAPGDGQGTDLPGEHVTQMYPDDKVAMEFFEERRRKESETATRITLSGIPFLRGREE